MSKVYRVYVEKKAAYALEAASLLHDLQSNLVLPCLTGLRLLQRYDVEGIDEATFQVATKNIFAEQQVDEIYAELPTVADAVFAIEYLPGQFDQRADSAAQCIQLLTQQERPTVRTARVYLLCGKLTAEQIEAIQKYLINPVEAQLAALDLPATLASEFPIPAAVAAVAGFTKMTAEQLDALITEMGLAMDASDIACCQQYFAREEKRDPTVTELRMLDTYWSDHCRHTTFATQITATEIAPDYIQQAFAEYLTCKDKVGRSEKPLTLMDIATLGTRYLKSIGLLNNLDESEEINACSIQIKVDVDGKDEDWLLLFKNETHNHPTEIEPFGGAATCLGGAIRDPLSGRAYVYQAMRITGAADPRLPFNQTLSGKLPQKKIVTQAAAGYSSYGNQIGLATGFVQELYHPNYVAKRMEIGAVIGAVPAANVVRERPIAGDVVVLLGGKTGRDGCGGATGSSKSHTQESLADCGSEVQKGNAPEERKIQRLFRDPQVTRLIKRCNDFGAGGISVAIGELADGLLIDLDCVPKKYEGLDGTELAISESQERMACVVAAADAAAFCAMAAAENIESTIVAQVQAAPRLQMQWRGTLICDIARSFLDSNGAAKNTQVTITAPDLALLPNLRPQGANYAAQFSDLISNLNICSQKGLVERFDSTIGAGTVTMPYGGKYQLTPTPFMAAKIPVLHGTTDTASLMAHGFNPYISEVSPFHGAVYAVLDSVARLVAAGIDYRTVYLTLQEYFERLQGEAVRWGKPFAALLGAFTAQIELGIAAIGGKDSMSGTFENIDVPPTLVSFAVGTMNAAEITTPEFKAANHNVYLLSPTMQANHLPNFNSLKMMWEKVYNLQQQGAVFSATALGWGGVAEAVIKAAMGNDIGFTFAAGIDQADLYNCCYGAILLETDEQLADELLIGRTQAAAVLQIEQETLDLDTLVQAWQQPLEGIFPTKTAVAAEQPPTYNWDRRFISSSAHRLGSPRILLPVFPGTNCEYDTARQFEQAGGICETFVVGNLSAAALQQSAARFVEAVHNSQIIVIPGGFSGGDEPEGSGKFIATFFRNPQIKAAVMQLLNQRDGLMLGICNGFQALIKLGLVPFGEIIDTDASCPTLTFNNIGRHQSMLVNTRIASVQSPWLAHNHVGDVHTIAISHGEGKFVADAATLQRLADNGQIATQYVDLAGNPTLQMPFNPNGSFAAIEGITSPDGRILGKMGHSERVGSNLTKNVPGNKDQLIFQAGVEYFK